MFLLLSCGVDCSVVILMVRLIVLSIECWWHYNGCCGADSDIVVGVHGCDLGFDG